VKSRGVELSKKHWPLLLGNQALQLLCDMQLAIELLLELTKPSPELACNHTITTASSMTANLSADLFGGIRCVRSVGTMKSSVRLHQ
jgi:hypothetical protein